MLGKNRDPRIPAAKRGCIPESPLQSRIAVHASRLKNSLIRYPDSEWGTCVEDQLAAGEVIHESAHQAFDRLLFKVIKDSGRDEQHRIRGLQLAHPCVIQD